MMYTGVLIGEFLLIFERPLVAPRHCRQKYFMRSSIICSGVFFDGSLSIGLRHIVTTSDPKKEYSLATRIMQTLLFATNSTPFCRYCCRADGLSFCL